jgi:hypothetical protein
MKLRGRPKFDLKALPFCTSHIWGTKGDRVGMKPKEVAAE